MEINNQTIKKFEQMFQDMDMIEGVMLIGFIITFYFMFIKSNEVKVMDVEILDDELDDNYMLKSSKTITKDFNLSTKPGILNCYDPATGQLIGEMKAMNADEVEDLIIKAKDAQVEWAQTSYKTRKHVLKLILRYLIENKDAVCNVSIRDSGKTKLGAVLGELTPTFEKLRWVINYGEDTLKPELRGGNGLLTMHKQGRVEYVPLGVIAVAAPFNYPLTNMLNHIISGLFCGNAVVVKVNEHTSWSSSYYLRIVRQALAEVNASPDLVQVITGFAEAGKALSESPNIDKFVFTGSDRVGKYIMQSCAKNLTPVVLELGGKDPFVVCKDVNLNTITPIVSRGVFQNAGGNCIGVERIYVEDDIYDEFVTRMTKTVKSIRQGIPLKEHCDLGCVPMASQIDIIQELIDDAVEKGAKVLCGGKRNKKLAPGLFYEPTLLVNVTQNMRITQEEVFGPVMVIDRFNNDQELLNRINKCDFGLGASVFCANNKRALKLANNINSGMVNVNDFGVNYLVQSLPFGGVKKSGFGRFGGPEGLKALCLMRSMTADAFYGISTSIPAPLAYPTARNSPTIAKEIINLAYQTTYFKQAKGLFNLLTNLIFTKK